MQLQEDLYPDTQADIPAITAAEWSVLSLFIISTSFSNCFAKDCFQTVVRKIIFELMCERLFSNCSAKDYFQTDLWHRWDGKNAEPVMMSMADGGGSAAGQQVRFLSIFECLRPSLFGQ